MYQHSHSHGSRFFLILEAKSMYWYIFSFSLIFIVWSAETTKSTGWKVVFFLLILGQFFGSGLDDSFVSKFLRNFYFLFMTAGGKTFAEKKILRGIFHGKVLSPLLFIMKPLFCIFRKYTRVTNSQNHKKKINHFMYMDNINSFANNEKELVLLIQTYSQDIRNRIWHGKNVLSL